MIFKPHTYQQQAINFLLKHDHAALFLDPGLGKTSITLSALCALPGRFTSGEAVFKPKVFVLAPLRVCYQVWSARGEIGKWAGFKDLRVSLIHGKDKEEALDEDADLYVMNYDGLPWLCEKGKGRMDRLLKHGVQTIVFDELSKMKNTQTARWKSLKPYLPKFKRRWGLTGSPAPNGLIDLFGQCKALDGGAALGEFITHYRMKYFVPCGFKGYDWRLAPGAEKQIYAAIKPLALSMRAVDHLPGLPELIEENMWVDLPAEAKTFYDHFEQELIAELDGEIVTANNAAVVSGKCRQIASGGMYLDNGLPGEKRIDKEVHTAKVDALADLVDELQGRPLFVGYQFRHELDRIRLKIGKVPAINGDTTPKDANEIIEKWNRGEIPVLLAHPAAAGHGLNMQGAGCGHVAWFSLPWDREHVDQFIARVWRQGSQAKHVIVHRILARDTVDAVVAKTIHAKGKTQDALFQALKDYAKDKARGK